MVRCWNSLEEAFVANTPKYLLDALEMVSAPRAPSAKAIGAVESLHVGRVRDVFEDKNIIAIGISEKVTEKKSTGTLSLCFYVEKKIPRGRMKLNKLVPPVIASKDGTAVFTDIKALGKVRPELRKKATPIQSGYSVAHVKTSAGTVAAIVKKGKKYYILSNSHVLALSGTAKKGDKVVYPGPADGGKLPTHLAGKLTHFVPFKVGNDFLNTIDAALAEIDSDRLDELDLSLYGVKGTPKIIAPARGMTVVKRGRTTNETAGVIEDVNFRVIMPYDEVGDVGFLDQVLCTRYTKPGDSGSLVVDKASGKIVGLHFAGANGGSVFNPIGPVMSALGFTFVSS